MTKTFTVAGTSNLNGVVKFRFANDLKSRVAVLTRNGHTDIDLRELPEAMTKAEAIAYLESLNQPEEDSGEVEQAETADTLRESLAEDGEDTSTMTDEFLGEVAAREMIWEGAPA